MAGLSQRPVPIRRGSTGITDRDRPPAVMRRVGRRPTMAPAPVTLALVLLMMMSSLQAAPAAVYPIEATTNQHVGFDSTTIVLDGPSEDSDRLHSGYVKVHNYRNIGWDPGANVGWDRYGDYYVLGAFQPAFNDDLVRSPEPARGWYDLLHAFFSIHIRYVEQDPGLTGPLRRYFQFGFYRDFSMQGGYHYVRTRGLSEPPDSTNPAVSFSPGDRLRYAVSHVATGSSRGLRIWVYNENTGALGHGFAAVYDTSRVNRPIDEFYIGTSSHGHMYDQTLGSTTVRDSFYGRISETIIGQGPLDPDDRTAWLETGSIPGAGSGVVLFRQSAMKRSVLVPLLHWRQRTPGCLLTGVVTGTPWTGEHMRLRAVPCSQAPRECGEQAGGNGVCDSVDTPPSSHLVEQDLTAVLKQADASARGLAFEAMMYASDGSYPGNYEATTVHVSLRDEQERRVELSFMPAAVDRAVGRDRIIEPLSGFQANGQWFHYEYDLLTLVRLVHADAARLRVEKIGLTGYASVADIRLIP
jgi:hypothetical protein